MRKRKKRKKNNQSFKTRKIAKKESYQKKLVSCGDKKSHCDDKGRAEFKRD